MWSPDIRPKHSPLRPGTMWTHTSGTFNGALQMSRPAVLGSSLLSGERHESRKSKTDPRARSQEVKGQLKTPAPTSRLVATAGWSSVGD